MQTGKSSLSISVIWRGKKFILETDSDATLKEFGIQLQKVTNVKADTLRLIVPESSRKSSKLFSPFSDGHSYLVLREISIPVGKSIRMMGVSEDEVDELLQNEKANLRIAGFDDEEKRLKQRLQDKPGALLKLPQGTYIFCDFRTLELPGVELNPPASEALKRMHMLASDPGVVAVMNKHRWRVGVMTEMAPVGYVGVSPNCLLGLNKNHGEEISLRLRTDDLKGFRKYETIKQTLLHELAHMIYSEHDANFYALNKQLNEEAVSLDWTKSRSHTLARAEHAEHLEGRHQFEEQSIPRKVGGSLSDQVASARVASVLAAHRRVVNDLVGDEPDPVDDEPDPDDESVATRTKAQVKPFSEPDPDDGHLKFHEFMECKHDDEDDVRPDCISAEMLQSDRPEVCEESDPDEAEQHNLEHEDAELNRIQDSVTAISYHLQKTVQLLQSEAVPTEMATVLQTLLKIIRNLVEHPGELKFRRLRMENPVFEKNVANHKGAMEVLRLAGFVEDGGYMVLKRDDPGLLWLVKSSLEAYGLE